MPSRVFSTSKRRLASAAAAGGFALLAAAVFLWPWDPADYVPVPSRTQPDGETIGWVSKVEANTIHVNSGPFGGGVVALIVSRNTHITVGANEGWFEDIRPGGQVKVAYDMFEGRRMARSVEILVDEGARRLSRGEMRLKGTTGPVTAEPSPTVAKTPADGRPAASDKAAESATRPAPVATSPTAPSTTSTEKPTPTPSVRTTPSRGRRGPRRWRRRIGSRRRRRAGAPRSKRTLRRP
jgi:hypothetical protein